MSASCIQSSGPWRSRPIVFAEQTYAGVAGGKLIGVLPRTARRGLVLCPTFAKRSMKSSKSTSTSGLNWPLIVPDDDISGTFPVFIARSRTMAYPIDIAPKAIGADTWLNYIVEDKNGTLVGRPSGVSTEHTAYLRLKAGIEAPQSGFSKAQ